MIAGPRLHQLRSDADPIASLAHAAFEHITHAEFAPDLFHIDRTAPVGEGRVPGDDEQRGIARQRSDDVLSDSVGDELLFGVAAHVGER